MYLVNIYHHIIEMEYFCIIKADDKSEAFQIAKRVLQRPQFRDEMGWLFDVIGRIQFDFDEDGVLFIKCE